MEREFFIIISSFVEGRSQIRPRVLSSLATPSSVTATDTLLAEVSKARVFTVLRLP